MEHSLVPIATSNITDLNCLIPRCCRCRREFNVYDNTPFILSCSHTFCCKCMAELNRNNSKNRRCPMCLVKYTTYQVNLHCLDLVVRLKIMTGNLNSCNECLKLVSAQHLRRCLTCEEEVLARTDFSRARSSKTRVSCVVCLECALENHKSHELRKETSLSTIVNRPTSIHTTNQQWSMGITTAKATMRTLEKEENSKKSRSKSARKDKAGKNEQLSFPSKLSRGLCSLFSKTCVVKPFEKDEAQSRQNEPRNSNSNSSQPSYFNCSPPSDTTTTSSSHSNSSGVESTVDVHLTGRQVFQFTNTNAPVRPQMTSLAVRSTVPDTKCEQTPLRVPIKNRFEYSNNPRSLRLRHQRSYVNAPSIVVDATPPTAVPANNGTMNKLVIPPICYTSVIDNSFYNKCP